MTMSVISDTILNQNQSNGIRKRKLSDQDDFKKDQNNLLIINEKSLKTNEIIEKNFNFNDLFTFNVKINLPVSLLFLIAFLIRFWNIGYPKNIVFDELHYGRFVSLYMKKIFYFDSQPPLGKQLISVLGSFFGYDGNNSFVSIGDDYPDTVPLKTLRFLPCLFGSLLVPLVYYIAKELNMSNFFSILASLLVLFENSLLTQSRFILMDSFLIFFGTISLYIFILFRKTKLFSIDWFIYLFLSCFFLSCAICVKFVGIIWLTLCLSVTLYDYWFTLPNKNISSLKLFSQGIIYLFTFLILPVLIYFGVFYIHLNILTKAGPHDTIMTSAFQASLEGGLSSIIKGQPLEIAHGSQITLKHTYGKACWLHSHAHKYPILYTDGRGSSHQQQVTCYSFKDVNNWWIVKRPSKNNLVALDPIDKIKHGDIIQLVHGMTSNFLNSHDVAAPMSPANQEVSCYINYNVSMPAQNLWKVELLNREMTNDVWHTIISNVRLVHLNSSQSLKLSGSQLPDWGFNQLEIVTDKNINNPDVVWNVEEHRYTKLSDEKERERDLVEAEFVPTIKTKFTFWEKMKELQYKMFIHDQENIQDHVFEADSPLDLILLNKGIGYWVHKTKNSQIFLLGNLFLHYSCLLSVFIYLVLLCFYLLRRRRKFFDISSDEWNKFINIGLICTLGYILQLLPLFFTNKTLFYHHYLPAIIFKILILSALLEHLKIYFKKFIYLLTIFIVYLTFYTFIKFLPLSYGIGLESVEEIESLKWKTTWNFIIQD